MKTYVFMLYIIKNICRNSCKNTVIECKIKSLCMNDDDDINICMYVFETMEIYRYIYYS